MCCYRSEWICFGAPFRRCAVVTWGQRSTPSSQNPALIFKRENSKVTQASFSLPHHQTRWLEGITVTQTSSQRTLKISLGKQAACHRVCWRHSTQMLSQPVEKVKCFPPTPLHRSMSIWILTMRYYLETGLLRWDHSIINEGQWQASRTLTSRWEQANWGLDWWSPVKECQGLGSTPGTGKRHGMDPLELAE